LVIVFYRWLAVSSFDATMAVSIGVPVTLVHYGLMTAVSVTALASFEAVGAILAIALMVVPAATAHILADRLWTMMVVAVAHAIISSVVGMYVSIWVNASTAGVIVVVGGVLYALAFLFGPRHGVVTKAWRGRGVALQG
jgi:manganese/zinc/iron transport system permease protein